MFINIHVYIVVHLLRWTLMLQVEGNKNIKAEECYTAVFCFPYYCLLICGIIWLLRFCFALEKHAWYGGCRLCRFAFWCVYQTIWFDHRHLLEKLRWEKPARHSEMNDQPVNFTGHRQQEGITAVQENMCTLFKLRHIVINKVIDKQTEFSYWPHGRSSLILRTSSIMQTAGEFVDKQCLGWALRCCGLESKRMHWISLKQVLIMLPNT